MGLNFGSSSGSLDPNPCYPAFRGGPCVQDGAFVGMFGRSTLAVQFRQVSDGLSNTIMVGETIPSHCRHNSLFGNNFPLASTHIPFNALNETDDLLGGPTYWRTSGFKSYHASGAHLLFGDGSVHFVSDTIDYYAYNSLGTTSGDESDARLP